MPKPELTKAYIQTVVKGLCDKQGITDEETIYEIGFIARALVARAFEQAGESMGEPGKFADQTKRAIIG